MIETIYLAKPNVEVTNTSSDTPIRLSDILINVIVGFLAPMFLGASGGNIGFARIAALQTINQYNARNDADLLSVAQIIGFGLGALGSLGLAMTDNLSLSMTLRLRGNATALHRAAEQNRRAVPVTWDDIPISPRAALPAEPRTPPEADLNETAIIAAVAAARISVTAAQARIQREAPPLDSVIAPKARKSAAEHQQQVMWTAAMADVAEEYLAGLPQLPAAERRIAALRAEALSKTIVEILAGTNVPRPRPVAHYPTVRPNAA